MRLLIIRHGESEADILKVHEGRGDYNITDKGRLQADRMAKFLKGKYDINKIYSSSLKRAIQTAEYISDEYKIPIIVEEDLKEWDNGLLAGLTFEEADEKYPKIENLPIHKSVYKQESVLEFRYRAERILSKIISENDVNAVIAIVSHGKIINQLYHAFLKLPIGSNTTYITGDTGIHEWLIKDNNRYILVSNYIVV